MRLTKHLAQQGSCSRREAEMFIQRGWIFVDGQKVTSLGFQIDTSSKIDLLPAVREYQNKLITVILNKPLGYVSGQPEKRYQPAASLITKNRFHGKTKNKNFTQINWPIKGLAPAGRLDIDSSGLLVLTQDGRVARKLISPDSEVKKEYLVRVNRNANFSQINKLRHGLQLDGVQLNEAQVIQLDPKFLKMILTQGRKRQIRRMCKLVGLNVTSLKRVRIGNVHLGSLPAGKWRLLHKAESF